MNPKSVFLKTTGPLLVAVLTLLVSACASNGAATEPGAQIPERAQARWDALLAEDFATAYSYMSPGYRSSRSEAQMEIDFRTRQVVYTSAEYNRHSCDENACTVHIDVGYKLLRAVPGVDEFDDETSVEERWIKSEGQWWFLPEN